MPSGKTHEQIGVVVVGAGVVNLAGSFFLGEPMIPLTDKVPFVLGLAWGVVLTPDIDLTTKTHEEKRMLQIPIVGKMWIAFWASYSWWFHHRGVSHWPVVGTLTRLFWMVRPVISMAVVLLLLVLTDTVEFRWLIDPEPIATAWMLPFFFGWTTQDFAHELADVLVSEHRRKKRDRKL